MQDNLIFQELEGQAERFKAPRKSRASGATITVLLCLVLAAMLAIWYFYYMGREPRARMVNSWDVRGSGEGKLTNWPIALSWGRGDIYLADIWGGKVVRYDSNMQNPVEYGSGLYADAETTGHEPTTAAVQMNPGKLILPRDVAVRENGEVYVLDFDTDSIHVYAENGKHLREWGNDPEKADSFFPGDAEFFQARSLAVDKDGNAYVADAGRHRIIKFDQYGKYILNWGSKGKQDDQFRYPRGLFIDSQDRLWVCDTMNSRIKVYDLEGKLLELRQMPVPMDAQILQQQWNYFFTNWRNGASASSSFANLEMVRKGLAPLPYDLAVDLKGNCYVTDQYRRLLKFSKTGKLKMVMLSHQLCGERVKRPYDRVGEITNSNRFMFSTITVDDEGDLYFSFAGDNLVRKFNTGR